MIVVQVVLGTIAFILGLLLIHGLRNFVVWLCERSTAVNSVVTVAGAVAAVSIVKEIINKDRK